jgi:hypothetical protein
MRRLVVPLALAALLIPATTAGAAVKRFTAQLSGSQEAPDPGDTDGTGSATLRIDRAEGTVCFTIRVRSIGRVVAGHIHKGSRGVAGDIVVTLIDQASNKTRFTGCAEDVSKSLISKIQRQPSRYYVNVHSEQFPGGAVRGQMRKARTHH